MEEVDLNTVNGKDTEGVSEHVGLVALTAR